MKNSKLNKNIKISLLAVIAFLLMFIEVAIPIFPEFLKIDISDLPALIGTFAFGPVAGIIIEFMKNLLHGLFAGKTAFIGELANFLVGAMLVITAGTIYNKKKDKTGAVIALLAGTVVMSLGAAIVNLFVLLPLYEKVLGFPISAVVGMSSKVNPKVVSLGTLIIWAIIPFNLIKGAVVCIMTRLVYKSVSPILHKEQMEIANEKLEKKYEQ
ncbi:ECF transporter S component [Haloimpatiens lingqiaonensis]|uniref:ECF transporter S component n=1 Tax=Haloimpatiens lingqiaonensis TaxID=1380675 RepID=UPI0010FCE69F|nr:ECF transporter S component [Haloimpatiens lingqiaonensis]